MEPAAWLCTVIELMLTSTVGKLHEEFGHRRAMLAVDIDGDAGDSETCCRWVLLIFSMFTALH